MGVPSCVLQLDGTQELKNSDYTTLRWADPRNYITTDRVGCPPEVYDPECMFNPLEPDGLNILIPGVYKLEIWAKFSERDNHKKLIRVGRRGVGYRLNGGNTDIIVSVGADPCGTTSLYAAKNISCLPGYRVSILLEQITGRIIYAVGHSAKDTAVGLEWLRELPPYGDLNG